jgi:NAD(P)-dependent dehydrogenase (short-subunit alcohol dehydrogenase family)
MQNREMFAIYPSLQDRVVLVTGGASGIGEAIVTELALQGAKVCFFDIQDEAADLVTRRLSSLRNPPAYYSCDLIDIAAVQRTTKAVVDRFGTVEVLVNNAGNDTRHKSSEVTPDFWDYTIAINLKHQFFVTQAIVPCMQRAQRGSIINMSSIGWVIPSINQAVYVAAKAAIVGMTRTLAHELGSSNIRVNSVMPGAVLTARQQRLWLTEAYKAEVLSRQALKRMILPDEVARLVLFLAADDSSAITNQSYVIDAGWV